MARFLLVHGAAHGAWCWRDMVAELSALGHSARAIDLPSHGADTNPPEQVTLGAYARAVVDALEGPTIVVAHSMAGYPVTLAAEAAPARITTLVYLCAYTPWPGKSIADMGRLGGYHPMQGMTDMAADRRSFTYRPEAAAKFYHDCPESALAYALPRLSRQPVAPLTTTLTPHRALTLPRHYITCTRDRAILPAQQAEMAAHFPAPNRHAINTGHSPFFAAPARLARILHKIAEEP